MQVGEAHVVHRCRHPVTHGLGHLDLLTAARGGLVRERNGLDERPVVSDGQRCAEDVRTHLVQQLGLAHHRAECVGVVGLATNDLNEACLVGAAVHHQRDVCAVVELNRTVEQTLGCGPPLALFARGGVGHG